MAQIREHFTRGWIRQFYDIRRYTVTANSQVSRTVEAKALTPSDQYTSFSKKFVFLECANIKIESNS